jgi:hypothetical protein
MCSLDLFKCLYGEREQGKRSPKVLYAWAYPWHPGESHAPPELHWAPLSRLPAPPLDGDAAARKAANAPSCGVSESKSAPKAPSSKTNKSRQQGDDNNDDEYSSSEEEIEDEYSSSGSDEDKNRCTSSADNDSCSSGSGEDENESSDDASSSDSGGDGGSGSSSCYGTDSSESWCTASNQEYSKEEEEIDDDDACINFDIETWIRRGPDESDLTYAFLKFIHENDDYMQTEMGIDTSPKAEKSVDDQIEEAFVNLHLEEYRVFEREF